MPRDRLRRSITTITQSGLELNGSVRFNLNPFGFSTRTTTTTGLASAYPTDDDLTETLRQVGLWPRVEEVGGLDSPMTELKLSHGQRQLFQLARAMVHRAATGATLLLMDEGTASMDDETERRVEELLSEAFAGCTKVIISHRPALLARADVVVRLDHGKAEVTRSGQAGEGRTAEVEGDGNAQIARGGEDAE